MYTLLKHIHVHSYFWVKLCTLTNYTCKLQLIGKHILNKQRNNLQYLK